MDARSPVSSMSKINTSGQNNTQKASIGIILFLSLLYFVFSYPQLSETNNTVLDVVALYKYDIIFNHQYWRLITGPLFHVTIEHLFANCLALYMFSYLLNNYITLKNYYLAIIITLCTADIFSLWFQPLNHASIGFSGVCFGIEGLYFSLVLKSVMQENYAHFLRQLITLVVYCAMTAGYYLLFMPQADHMAHLGGFLGGLLFGFLVPKPPTTLDFS